MMQCCIWVAWLRKTFYLAFSVQGMFRFNLDLIWKRFTFTSPTTLLNINLNFLMRVYGRCSFIVHLLIGHGQSSFCFRLVSCTMHLYWTFNCIFFRFYLLNPLKDTELSDVCITEYKNGLFLMSILSCTSLVFFVQVYKLYTFSFKQPFSFYGYIYLFWLQ